MIKQRIFDKENINQVFISPYTDIYGKGTRKVLLLRTDTGNRLLFESESPKMLIEIIAMLENGIEYDRLEEISESYGLFDIAEWIKLGIEKGVFE